MFYRDSSVATHHGRGMIIGADSSHGVKIEGGSTGGVIEPVGDDAAISIRVRGKGAGGVLVGNATSALGGYVVVTSTTVVLAETSTEVRQQFSTMTAVGVTTGATIVASERTSDTHLFLLNAVCSSADEVILSWLKPHKTASTESTRSVRIAAFQ